LLDAASDAPAACDARPALASATSVSAPAVERMVSVVSATEASRLCTSRRKCCTAASMRT
jgi:hypothetical protein